MKSKSVNPNVSCEVTTKKRFLRSFDIELTNGGSYNFSFDVDQNASFVVAGGILYLSYLADLEMSVVCSHCFPDMYVRYVDFCYYD